MSTIIKLTNDVYKKMTSKEIYNIFVLNQKYSETIDLIDENYLDNNDEYYKYLNIKMHIIREFNDLLSKVKKRIHENS